MRRVAADQHLAKSIAVGQYPLYDPMADRQHVRFEFGNL